MSKQDDKHKHLEFIQLIITRMGANSFLIKGWTVTISAALFALADRDSNPTFVIIALVAAISFWGLDAYYLRQERLFIKLYEHTVDDEVKPFSMDVSKYSSEVSKWSNTLFSTTVIGLHGVTLLAIISSIFFLYGSRITIWQEEHSLVSTSNEISGEQDKLETHGLRTQTGSHLVIGMPQSGKKQK